MTAISAIGRIARGATAACALLLAPLSAAAAPAVTQTFELQPGWNAIYLEVQPEPRDPATVFSGLPVKSVWARYDRNSPVEFIQNPAEGLEDLPGWLAWYSAPEDSPLSSLHAILANSALLVKLDAAQPATLSVSGAPRLQPREWLADSFNLTGFPVDPSRPTTFEAFFRPSPAQRGQAAYRLGAAGSWQIVDSPAQTPLRSGEAYWVYCDGASAYGGPLKVEVDGGELAFDRYIQRATLKITNLSDAAKSVTVRISPEYPGKFAYREFNEASGYLEYSDLAGLAPVQIAPGSYQKIVVSVQPQAAPATLDAVLTISDSEGSRIMVPVSVAD